MAYVRIVPHVAVPMATDNYRFQDDTRPLSPEKADEAARAREDVGDGPHLGEPPEENKPPRLRPPVSEAAGLRAIGVTMKYGFGEMGPARSVRNFLAMNKVDGFDCQSCAWPSPDPAHRKVAEFCENGAKAVVRRADAPPGRSVVLRTVQHRRPDGAE